MNLTLIRTHMLADRTYGLLDIDGNFFCHSLEDVDRKLECGGDKCYGETAIPRGKYVVVLDFSARFKRTMPHVLGVPQFDGVRIHTGNYAGYEVFLRSLEKSKMRRMFQTDECFEVVE